jgi:hypothetical protein
MRGCGGCGYDAAAGSELIRESLSAEGVLLAVGDLAQAALEAFAKARKLNPDDNHGYITPIQTILMVAERMYQASGHNSIAQVGKGDGEVAQWIQNRVSDAEELLARLQQFRGQKKQSEHERRCEYQLTALYGNFDDLIKTWEEVLDGSASQVWLRKAVANAYLARRERNWRALSLDELRRIVELTECNLSYNPTSEGDLRAWFQAYRFLPEFSYNEAFDRLLGWAGRSDSVDAHYYLYILHFLRWREGGERDEQLIHKHLKRSAELSVGRHDNSYEWCASEPHWCPLVNSRELGGWVDQKNFFRDVSKLAFLEGTISALKRTAGTIRIGNTTRAFFRPPPHLRESEHLNAKVHFVLGFSYERMNAWLVELGPAPVPSVAISKQEAALIFVSPESLGDDSSGDDSVRPVATRPPRSATPDSAPLSENDQLRGAALHLIKSLLRDRKQHQKHLAMWVISTKLLEHFPGNAPVHRRLGFDSVLGLVSSWNELTVTNGPNGPLVAMSYME